MYGGFLLLGACEQQHFTLERSWRRPVCFQNIVLNLKCFILVSCVVSQRLKPDDASLNRYHNVEGKFLFLQSSDI